MQLELSELITIALVCIAFGVGSSVVLKRIDLLHKLSRNFRRNTNGVVNLFAPFLAIVLTPLWTDSMGDLGEFSNILAAFLVSFITFTASQVAHEKDVYQSPVVGKKSPATTTKKK